MTTLPASARAKQGAFHRFMEAEFNHPSFYPTAQQLDPALYRPAAEWFGRLILPRREERLAVMGVLFEVHHADAEHAHFVGSVVRLRWTDEPETHARFWSVSRQVSFTEVARKLAQKGNVLPERVDGWNLVNPFESLAAAWPSDEVMVRLQGAVRVEERPQGGGPPIVYTAREPSQITGRYYALVRFTGPESAGGELFRVAHYRRDTGAFDGPEEVVRLPRVVPDHNGTTLSVSDGIERSPANEEGWYVYGAQDRAGVFVVQALVPRGLFRLQPGSVVVGQAEGRRFLKPKSWQETDEKGTFTSTLICPDGTDSKACLASWREGDAALVVHLYGYIAGPNGDPSAKAPLNWGHFSFGVARVVREPLADELRFDIDYHQIYVNNVYGVISGTQHWTRYSGDRQFGWAGSRPIQDILIKLDCFTEDYDLPPVRRSALTAMAFQLEVMGARYRIADGRGGTRITGSNNCAQDSNQALYAAIKRIESLLRSSADIADLRARDPSASERLARLEALGNDLRRVMLPLGSARADWEWGVATLGSSIADSWIRGLGLAVRSWRTLLPSVAARAIAGVFLHHGATAWVLRTNQVGGYDPGIRPYVPNV